MYEPRRAHPGKDAPILRFRTAMQHHLTDKTTIHSGQSSTLVDRFGRVHRYLRVSVTDRCNLNCHYCRPSGGYAHRDRKELLTLEEMYRIISLLSRFGIEKVRFTGGEPMLRRNLIDLISRVRSLPEIRIVALTTNGVTLSEYVPELKRVGLDSINISLDTLRAARYSEFTGFDYLTGVLDGIERCTTYSIPHVKVNSVVIAGKNDDELCDFVEYFRDKSVTIRFIEYMPFRGNDWERSSLLDVEAMKSRILDRYKLTPEENTNSDVATVYSVSGYACKVGFISPMSSHFCDRCDRLRITADGAIKSCLFHPAESLLRDLIRSGGSDDDLMNAIRTALGSKPEHHQAATDAEQLRAMIEIGG